MAYKSVPHGYEVKNPYGELLMYHDTDITVETGVGHDHADITAANGQTVYTLTAPTAKGIFADTIVAEYQGVEYTDTIAAGDVTATGANLHDITIAGFSTFPSAANNPRHQGAVLGIGSHVTRGYTSFEITGGDLILHFPSQSTQSRERAAILNQISGGNTTFGIGFISLVATVTNVADEKSTTPDVTLTPGGLQGERVSFDFDEVITQTHASSASTGGVQIPLIPGTVLEFAQQTDSYVVIDDTPVRNKKSYYV